MKIIQLANGISQHTYPGGRFYQKDGIKVPSVTTVTAQLAKGPFFDNFLKTNGAQADEITKAAAIRGSVVHQAIERQLRERRVTRTTDIFYDPENEKELRIDDSPDATDIWRGVQGFTNWYTEVMPRTVAIEETFFLKQYAGTIDYVCYIEKEGKEELHILDFKTSTKDVYKSVELQISAYKYSQKKYKDAKLGVLQVGTKTKKSIAGKQGVGWRFTAIDDHYIEFMQLLSLWKFVTGGEFPPPPPETPEVLTLPPERKPKRNKSAKKQTVKRLKP